MEYWCDVNEILKPLFKKPPLIAPSQISPQIRINIAKRQRGGSTSSRTQFRGGKNLVFDVLSIFQTQRLRKIHEILVIFMHFSQRISGSFSAPREVLISSLVPLESSSYKLSSGTRLDVGSSRCAECERERVRWKRNFGDEFLIFFFLRLQGCYRETNINSCCGRLWATLGDFFQILRP